MEEVEEHSWRRCRGGTRWRKKSGRRKRRRNSKRRNKRVVN